MWSDWLVVCDCGFSLSALWSPLSVLTVLLGFHLPWMWGLSSQLLQQSAAAAPDLWCRVASLGRICAPSCRRTGWSNRQIWPWSTEWSRAKANRVLSRKCTGHSKHLLPKTQEKTLHMDITRWSTPKSDWLYSLQPKMEKLYTVSKNKTRSWLWLGSWTPYCQIQTEIEESGENH